MTIHYLEKIISESKILKKKNMVHKTAVLKAQFRVAIMIFAGTGNISQLLSGFPYVHLHINKLTSVLIGLAA